MLGREDDLRCRAAVRFFLRQVKNLNLAVFLLKDKADVYSPWKPLDKCTLPVLPALNPKCYSTNHIPHKPVSYSLATAEPSCMSN